MTTPPETVPPPSAPTDEQAAAPWRATALVAVAVVVVAAGLGSLGGWLWYSWWGPPNEGAIYDTADGPLWFDPSDQGLAHQFDGPAQYAVIGLGLGIVLGVVAAVLGRRQPLASLAALVAGSALAACLAWAVGTALSPPDPERYATEANVCTAAPCEEYPAAIEISGWTPLLMWPIGALTGLCGTIAISQWIGTTRTMLDELQPLPSAKDARSEQPPPPSA